MNEDPKVFIGRVDAEGAVHLDKPQDQRAHCKAVLAGKRVGVVIYEEGELKTRLQEQGFHVMLGPWARDGHSIKDLKHDLLLEIFGEREHVNALTGVVSMVLREPHTSTLSKAKYSWLIERTLEIAAQNGYVLEAPSEYTKRKEEEQRKKTAAREKRDRQAFAGRRSVGVEPLATSGAGR